MDSENKINSQELLEQLKKLATDTLGFTPGTDQLAQLVEKGLARATIKPLTEFIDQLPVPVIQELLKTADETNRVEQEQKYSEIITISIDAKDEQHAVAVFNDFYRKYASKEQLEAVIAKFNPTKWEFFRGYLLTKKKVKQLKRAIAEQERQKLG